MAKILLAEDDAFLTTMYKTRFEGEGNQVLVASDGETALTLIRQELPQLVILDVMLPKVGGFTILEEMQRDVRLKNIPVIVLSNLTDEESIAKAKALGIKEFLVKASYTPTQIFEIVKKYLPQQIQS